MSGPPSTMNLGLSARLSMVLLLLLPQPPFLPVPGLGLNLPHLASLFLSCYFDLHPFLVQRTGPSLGLLECHQRYN